VVNRRSVSAHVQTTGWKDSKFVEILSNFFMGKLSAVGLL